MNELALQRTISDVVAEYEFKLASVDAAVSSFSKAGDDLKSSACVGGTWGNTQIDVGSVYDRTIKESLLKSAWLHIFNGLNINRIASAADKRKFDQTMNNPPPFTLENIRATFGDYVADPFGNILRGLAETFCDLDPAYKSHDKVKIGVEGLPKRIILSNVGSYGSWGKDRLENVLNALAAYQRKPLVTWTELNAILENGNALLEPWTYKGTEKDVSFPARGVSLKRFKNGNGHLIFEPDTLKDINRALAQYYGEVLADCSDDEPKEKRQSTAVSKDLQYYPTPQAVVDHVLRDFYKIEGQKVLEPSCGCGRFMDALASMGANVFGIEVDAGRAELCRQNGHRVMTANFLETVPNPVYDRVVMNPPFYGKHYAKHVIHALKFLKPGGILTAILPITARYDHGALDHLLPAGKWKQPWSDLPVGSFRESGTNINTTILTLVK